MLIYSSFQAELGTLVNGDQVASEEKTAPTVADDGKKRAKVETNNVDLESTLSLLRARIVEYRAAQTNASQLEDVAKVRRFSRGITTLERLMKTVESGSVIDHDEIPPPLPTNLSKVTVKERAEGDEGGKKTTVANARVKTTAQASTLPAVADVKGILVHRRDAYKKNAALAKRENDKEGAVQFFKIAKQFDAAIQVLLIIFDCISIKYYMFQVGRSNMYLC